MSDPQTTPQANAEMIEGFVDGYDLSNPEPSDNRSRSYRHGFRSGRADKGLPRKESFDEVRAMAEEAMKLDALDRVAP
jgi:hypothetical protein